MASGRRRAAGGRRLDLRALALALLAGVAAAYRCSTPGAVAWLVVAAVLAMPFVWRFSRLRAVCAAFLAGVALLAAYNAYLQAGRLPAALDDTELVLRGTVSNLPTSEPGRIRFLFSPISDDAPVRRIRVSWYDAPAEPVRAGQCWRLRLKLSVPRGLRNPGGFDYAGWLFRRGVGATAYVRAAEACPEQGGNPVLLLRQRLVDWIDATLDGHPMTGIVQALTVGWQARISDAQWRVLRRTGTTHLVSISGLHVGVIAGFLFVVSAAFWRRLGQAPLWLPATRAAAMMATAGAAGYALMAGFSLPVQRSVIMVAVAMAGLLMDRRAAPGHMLAVALVAVLLAGPLAVGSPGFWLSFGAVAWLLYAFTGRLRRPGRTVGWVRSQAVLMLGLAPLTAFWFQQGSLVAPLANLVMIPLYSALTPVLLLAVLSASVGPLGEWLIIACAWVLDATWPALVWLSSLPMASVNIAAPPLSAIAVALVGLILVLAPRGAPARIAGLVLCLPLLAWPPPAPPAPGGARLTILDVGHGLAVVVRTHGHVLLYDTGPAYRTGFDAGDSVILPFLGWAGIDALDRVILSHPDLDHAGGWPAVRRGVAVHSLWRAQNGLCEAGRHWRWDGVNFRVLHPSGPGGGSENDRSCVLRVQVGEHVVLLTGDIEASAEEDILRRVDHALLRADVLLVPHHGSLSSSSTAFVAAVDADLALISTDRGNRWNFPRPEVVRRYRERGAEVISTGDAGAIRLDLRPGEPLSAPIRWRADHPRLWTLP